MTALGDAELFDLWATGDRAAGEILFARHFTTVRSYFRRRAERASDDLVQQTFLACVEARDRYRGEASFRTFILAIARHQLYRHCERRRMSALGPNAATPDPGPSPLGVLALREDRRSLALALECLPDILQEVVELVYWEECRAPEVAVALEVPLPTAYSRLRRAKEQLRLHFAQVEGAARGARGSKSEEEVFDAWSERVRRRTQWKRGEVQEPRPA